MIVGCKIRRMEVKPTIPSLRFVKYPLSPRGVFFPNSRPVLWMGNGVRLSRKFRSRGLILIPKWVLIFIARRKLEPMDLRNEGLNVIE